MSGISNLVVLLDPGHPEAAEQECTESDAAFDFLKKASRVKSNMAHFAETWERLRPKRLKGKEQKDRDILKGLAGLMADGKIALKSRHREGGGDDDEEAPAAPAPAPRRKQAISGSGMKIRDRPDPPPPAPPPPKISTAQQVDALKSAAESGAPFVEQCTAEPADNT